MSDNGGIVSMLEGAMRVQKRSVRVYELMAAAARSPKDRELLRTIRREERRHYYFLEGIYEELTGKAVQPVRTALSLPRYYPDMLRTAICDKLETIDRLELIMGELRCVKQRQVMDIILTDQKEHARILGGIYGRCQ
ncbi:MAG: ferritin-like domain-containing protein [Firmicutes bacterium]|nr:ferritin-like domain-containing protein [Bacillota bacterium]